jgi:N-acetylglutamate synthase-like GNAT family acetyltransferase
MEKKNFKDIGDVDFIYLTQERIDEVAEFIINVYQHANIWQDYTKEEVKEELLASFSNYVYKPVFILALHEGTLIGAASYMWSHMSSQAYELSFASVLPEHQRKGLGTYLIFLRLKEILEIRNRDAVIFTRCRRPTLFQKFGFQYVRKHMGKSTAGSQYMYCPAEDVDLNGCNRKVMTEEEYNKLSKSINEEMEHRLNILEHGENYEVTS